MCSHNDYLTCVLNQTTPVHSSKQYYVADHDKNERDQKHYHEQVVQHHLKQNNKQYTINLHRTRYYISSRNITCCSLKQIY